MRFGTVGKWNTLFGRILLGWVLLFPAGATQADESVFATVHLLSSEEMASDPQLLASFVSQAGDENAGAVWIYDTGLGKTLMQPVDVTAPVDIDELNRLFPKVPGDGQGAASRGDVVIDVNTQKKPLQRLLAKVADGYLSANGSDAVSPINVDVVFWADHLKVAQADLSAAYLPAGCFGPADQQPQRPQYLSIDLPPGLAVHLFVRSLDPDKAAATPEALRNTLPSLMLYPADTAGQRTVPVTEARADCLPPTPSEASAPVGTVKAEDCVKGVEVPTQPPQCAQPIVFADLPQGGTPTPGTAPAGDTAPPDAPANPGTPPGTAPAKAEDGQTNPAGEGQPPAPVEPAPLPTPAVEPPVDPAMTDPAGQQPTGEPEDVPPVDQNLPAADAGHQASAAPVFAAIMASASHVVPGKGLTIEIEGAPSGATLTVVPAGAGPGAAGAMRALTAVDTAKLEVHDKTAARQGGSFDVFLALPAGQMCSRAEWRLSARIALPLAAAAQVQRTYDLILAPARCPQADQALIAIDRFEVP